MNLKFTIFQHFPDFCVFVDIVAFTKGTSLVNTAILAQNTEIRKITINNEKSKNYSKNTFTVFWFLLEKHESTIDFSELQCAFPKMYDIFGLSRSLKKKTLTPGGATSAGTGRSDFQFQN